MELDQQTALPGCYALDMPGNAAVGPDKSQGGGVLGPQPPQPSSSWKLTRPAESEADVPSVAPDVGPSECTLPLHAVCPKNARTLHPQAAGWLEAG